jgi:hypothetical protein
MKGSPLSSFSRIAFGALLLGAICCAPADAARPMVTDDASIVAPGDCQLEAWTQHTSGQNEYWAVPACNPYGNWELSAGAGRIVPRDDTGGYVEKMLQAKTLFRPVTPNGWGIGLTVANTSRGDAFSGDLSVLVPLSFSLLDDKVLIHLNAGVLRERLSAHRTGSQWAGGTEWAATHDLALTLEAYGTQQGHNYAQTGLRFTVIPDRLDLDMGVGERINAHGEERYYTFGLTYAGKLRHWPGRHVEAP